MFYAGIGSRNTPVSICHAITRLAQALAKYSILRSGGADGADSAFENGCDLANGKKEIYLPWKNFNDNKSELYNITKNAQLLAEQLHPAWNRCSYGAKKLHARNCYQILGYTLDYSSSFVICWTKDGKEIGGTATALKLANHYSIPIFNFGSKTYDLDEILSSQNKTDSIAK